MRRRLRPIGHEDRLSLVDHLDELRNRLIISGAVLLVAFGVCFWQNHALLNIINKPLKQQTRKQAAKGENTVGQAVLAQKALLATARDTGLALRYLTAPGSGLSATTRAELTPLIKKLKTDVSHVPRNPSGDKPAVLGVGEGLTTTLTVAFYFALIVSLPVILYELAGFVLPALKPDERRAAAPLVTAVPGLFVAGVAFGYFIVLPAATHFLVNFNASEFNVIVQASQYYSFAATVLLAMGGIFQVPVLIVGATRLGLVTPTQLRHNRRIAIVACAAVAAFLPGDVITLILETAPLYLLYEVSILLAVLVLRSRRRREAAVAASGSEGDPQPPSGDPGEPTVQQIIDHVDNDLSG